jgi:uncharacterized repeat protein (TIGR04138 family)
MTFFHPGLAEVVRRDPRYAYEAYEFVFHGLHHTQKLLGREPPAPSLDDPEEAARPVDPRYHVSGAELVHGIRDLALREFGLMARTVFRLWGVNATADFGEIVFNLIDAGLMSKTEQDRREDFHNIYDLDRALVHGYRIQLDEAKQ